MKQGLASIVERMKRSLWVLHPFLFFFYSVYSLLVKNPDLPARAMFRTLAIGTIVLLSILAFGRIRRNGERVALFTSGVIVLFFTYGHLVYLLENYLGRSLDSAAEWLLLIPIVAAASLWALFALRRLRRVAMFTQYFLAVGLLVNVFPLFQQVRSAAFQQVAQDEFQTYHQAMLEQLGVVAEPRDAQGDGVETQRDIYFIVLDAYARADVLQDLYGYDNSRFLDFLEQRGFYLASSSHANYVSTELSIAATLNMSYLTDMPDLLNSRGGADEDSVKRFAADLVGSNLLMDFLQDRGYTIVAFESGYDSTVVRNADLYLQSPEVDRGSFWRAGFEFMLLDSSLGRLLMKVAPKTAESLNWLFDLHRARILYAIDHLPDFTQDDRPTFVYAHIISPHTPYVFGPNGERVRHEDPFSLLDANPGNPENIRLYRDQVEYLNSLIMDVIDAILDRSAQPPIIILQADHGSKVFRDRDPAPEIECRLNLPILNAVYFPGLDAGSYLYPSISPVNSFRLMLNAYFGQDLRLLPDESFVLRAGDAGPAFVSYADAVSACP